ncbi:MAG: tRNA lysidine(34) synthetase TilS, partial [Clostridia bacterium]|nr:tRNA lysidine(34) synthetase TilS [Clostridia bacterium]
MSGGVDSVSLLHYLKTHETGYGYTLSACHCEHGIRGEESVEDMRFVEDLCKAWEIPLTIFRADCPALANEKKESLETAARRFRQECFARLRKENRTDFIATAHHQEDNAETVLFRLLRGTSLTGVGGMSAMNDFLIRPFLNWSRQEILVYAQENGLIWREDKTNAETQFTRNFLRHKVFPLLEECVPNGRKNLLRFSELATEDDALLYTYAEKLLTRQEEEIRVDFCEEKPIFRRACLLAFKWLGLERDYTALHLEQAYNLQTLERGAKLTLPQNVEGEKREKHLAFYLKKLDEEVEKSPMQPFDKNSYEGGRYAVSVSKSPQNTVLSPWKILRVDGDKFPKDVVYRFREEGDYICAFGGGKKTLKKFFNEKKIPSAERAYLPLIAERNGYEVFVICGVEISEKVK